jgi:excisionase family DNA binding protein
MAKVMNDREEVDAPGLEACYSIRQLVRHFRVSEAFWRRELADGKLRFFRVGALIRIPRSALDEYLGRSTKRKPGGVGLPPG